MQISYLAEEALKIAKHNSHRSWNGGQSARARFESGTFLKLRLNPRFSIEADAKIFTMGSCFARNVENVLSGMGVPILLNGLGIRRDMYNSYNPKSDLDQAQASRLDRGAFNKYSVHSMAHEIKRVLTGVIYPQEGLIELEPNRWFDPHATRLKVADFETTLANRTIIHEGNARIRQADVVFLTLGLTESWVDRETESVINTPPEPAYLKHLSDRFLFTDFGYAETLRAMVETINLVREVCNPAMRFVVTVSPVPLGSTFKDMDVIVANGASKAILRAVADELMRMFDCVDYFPSYEMVINSPRELAWEPDQVHVSGAMVASVMKEFVEAYMVPKSAVAA